MFTFDPCKEFNNQHAPGFTGDVGFTLNMDNEIYQKLIGEINSQTLKLFIDEIDGKKSKEHLKNIYMHLSITYTILSKGLLMDKPHP